MLYYGISISEQQIHRLQLKSSYIFMLHVFEESQLSVGSFGKKFGLEGPVELLDGHLSP